MLTLITSIIAIALVVVIAAAGAYFGGDIYDESKMDAEAAKLMNEGAQIVGAMTVYESDGNSVEQDFQLENLVEENYLTTIPEGWTAVSGMIAAPIVGTDAYQQGVCFTANSEAGYFFEDPTRDDVIPYEADPDYAIPYCDYEDLSHMVPCCVLR